MKYVIIQKTISEVNHNGDYTKDILELFPPSYPYLIKYKEYDSSKEAQLDNPSCEVMGEQEFKDYKYQLDFNCKELNKALKLRSKQKAIEFRLSQENLWK